MKENRIIAGLALMGVYRLMIVLGWLGATYPVWLEATGNLLFIIGLAYCLFSADFLKGWRRVFLYAVLATSILSLVLRLVG